MQPYGLQVIESPDINDIQQMGSKGSVGKFPGCSGLYHPYCRGAAKARTRRIQARRARRANKAACSEES